MSGAVVAVDLGATSGRVILGRVGHGRVELETVHRFSNDPVATPDGLHWNLLEIWRNILVGIREARRAEPTALGVSVDSWAVDYALLRRDRVVGMPFHYRDARSVAGQNKVVEQLGVAELFSRNGLQQMPFNTLYQLAMEGPLLQAADRLLLIPDLIGYFLTGRGVTERTNASTTGLLSVTSREWDDHLISELGFPRRLFGELADPGSHVGRLLPGVKDLVGGDLAVTTVGSHDTASAVVGTPLEDEGAAYISCGTWGLVGLELREPILSPAARDAGFTNEGGVDGRVRFLRNVMGLWVLSETLRAWEREGLDHDLPSLLEAAAAEGQPGVVFDANDARFFPPGDMSTRIRDWCSEQDLAPPRTGPQVVRSIVESLAQAFVDAALDAAHLAGRTLHTIHLVGGGSLNTLLCQRVADRSGLRVLAGPVEATALGNVLIQARTHGLLGGSLEDLRQVVAASTSPEMYEPAAH